MGLCDLNGIVGSAEVPPAAVCMRPQQEGSVAKESVGKAPVGHSAVLDCPESLLRQLEMLAKWYEFSVISKFSI